jgi:hypothetical protein
MRILKMPENAHAASQGRQLMAKKIGYVWHLRRLMADKDMYATMDLRPLLAERGVALSREQVYRAQS